MCGKYQNQNEFYLALLYGNVDSKLSRFPFRIIFLPCFVSFNLCGLCYLDEGTLREWGGACQDPLLGPRDGRLETPAVCTTAQVDATGHWSGGHE